MSVSKIWKRALPESTEQYFSRRYPAKRAFITGAASGLGLSFVKILAADGWKIGLGDIDEARLIAAAEAVATAGGEATIYTFDVSDSKKFRNAVQNFCKKYGGIDIAVNSAGIGCGGPIDEVSIETFKKVIDINLMGTVNGCHCFVPVMKAQKSGHILNIASAAAFASVPNMSAYNTSKAGVLALSETLRGELQDHNLLVTVLMTTYVRTNVGLSSLGPELYNRRAQELVKQAQLEPDYVARAALEQMAAGALYVVLPDQARFLWRFKRFFPQKFWRFIADEAQRRLLKIDQSLPGAGSDSI